jgi:hypothetical protein
VGGRPGPRHAASLLRVHNPPFDAFLLRRGRRSLLSYAQIVFVNEAREQVEPVSPWDLDRSIPLISNPRESTRD